MQEPAGAGQQARCSPSPSPYYSELLASRGGPTRGRVMGWQAPAGGGAVRTATSSRASPDSSLQRRPRGCSRGAGRRGRGAKPWRARDPTGEAPLPRRRLYFGGHIFLLYPCVEEIVPFRNDFFLCAFPSLVPEVRVVVLSSSPGSESASGMCTLYLTPQMCFLGS